MNSNPANVRNATLISFFSLLAVMVFISTSFAATSLRSYGVSGGGFHTVAMKDDGMVWSWGDNGYGQLGDGGTALSYKPVFSNISGVISVSAGQDHSLALREDGTVWGWGRDYYGQLGIGSSGDYRNAPEWISSLSAITAISAGNYFSVARKNDGTVWTWGYNSFGQLGDNSTTQSLVPKQVSGLSGIIAIAAGGSHTVALKDDGTVWAWGANSTGQLGDGTVADKWQPVQVEGLTGVIAISALNYHTMALKSDGTVWGWGSNSFGELGNGTTSTGPNSLPVQATGVNGAIAIAAGDEHSVVLKNDGTVWSWGNNGYGVLGDGTSTNSSTPVQVVDPTPAESGRKLSGVTAISAGSYFTFALKTDHSVWGWGVNISGQLGVGTAISSAKPIMSLLGAYEISTAVTSYLGPGGATVDCPNAVLPANIGSCTITPNQGFDVINISGCGGTWSAGNPYSYNTGAISGDCTITVSLNAFSVNGVCGSANGQTLPAIPSTFPELCAAGTPTAVTGEPWKWNCVGINKVLDINTTDAACTANYSGSANLAAAVGNPGLSFTYNGAAPWLVDGAVIKSGAIAAGQSSSLATTVVGPALLSFDWKVTSEPGYDNLLRLTIDGVQQETISGNVDWHQRIYPLGNGSHSISWAYSKNYPVGNTGWLDNIQVTNCAGVDMTTATASVSPTSVVLPFTGTTSVAVTVSGTPACSTTYKIPAGSELKSGIYVLSKTLTLTVGDVILIQDMYLGLNANTLVTLDHAGSGALDTTFNPTTGYATTTGTNNEKATILHPANNSSIFYKVGVEDTGNGLKYSIQRLKTSDGTPVAGTGNGTPDLGADPVADPAGFDPNGRVTLPTIATNSSFPTKAALQSDGKIVVFGYSDGLGYSFDLYRLNVDGSLDSTFAGSGRYTESILIGFGPVSGGSVAVVTQPGADIDKIIVAVNNVGEVGVVRYMANASSIDSTGGFGDSGTGIYRTGTGGSLILKDMTQGPNGRIILAGQLSGAKVMGWLMSLNANGSVDTAFGSPNGYVTFSSEYQDVFHAVTVQSDGKIIVTGQSDDINYYGLLSVLRFSGADGSLDASFANGGVYLHGDSPNNDYGNSVAVKPDGKIVVGGSVWNSEEYISAATILSLNADGTLDTSFGYNGVTTFGYLNGWLDGDVNALSILPDANILAAGYIGSDNFVLRQFVQVAPVITWANPAAILYGTALSTTQLNATASVPGAFTYAPAIGTILTAGTQALLVTFTPTDTTKYTTATKTVNLTVNPLGANEVMTGPDGKTTVTINITVAGASINIPAGTLLTDANGNPIIGILTVTASVKSSIAALPAGLSVAQTTDGKVLSVLGNAIDITISAGAATVKNITPAMIVNLPIPASFASPGATVSYYSFDGTTWHLEGTTTVKSDGSVDIPVGHLSVWAVAAFVPAVDAAAPVVSAFTMPATSSALSVSVTTFTATDDVGVTGYLLTTNATAPLASDAAWTATAPTSYTFTTWGNNTLYAYAKDAVGNVSTAVTAVVLIGTADGVIVPPPLPTDPPKLTPKLSDALKSLNFAMKVEIPTAAEILHGDVAPLVNGVPQPDGKINLGDTIVILRRVVGL